MSLAFIFKNLGKGMYYIRIIAVIYVFSDIIYLLAEINNSKMVYHIVSLIAQWNHKDICTAAIPTVINLGRDRLTAPITPRI